MSDESEISRRVLSGRQAAAHGAWRRLLTESAYRRRLMRYALGLATPLDTADRRVLETAILPWYAAQADVQRVLFVGCDWYTRHYGRAYFHRQTYWTLDPAVRARRFGGRLHLQIALEALTPGHAGHFDLIVVNGVYGFGLDTREQCEQAFAACFECLNPGAWLILGWDDVPARRPVPLGEIRSLSAFARASFPPLRRTRILTATPWRHTYDFFRRPAHGRSGPPVL